MRTFSKWYHPERHYMRGAGPKWHEKHKAALLEAASAQPKDAQAGAEATPGVWSWIASRHARVRYDLGFVHWIVPLTAAALLGFVVVFALA